MGILSYAQEETEALDEDTSGFSTQEATEAFKSRRKKRIQDSRLGLLVPPVQDHGLGSWIQIPT